MITKYFVANLPEGCTPWELRKALEGFGEITGTYVAKKKDKGGGRFGFVSFVNVRDRSELEKSLHGARMGACMLKVNIARFAVENSGFGVQKDVRANVGCSAGFGESQEFWRCGSGCGWQPWGHREDFSGSGSYSCFQSLVWAGIGGEECGLGDLVDIDRLLMIARTELSRIHCLGGLSILISFKNIDSAREFLNARTIWGPWFTKLESWNGQSLSLERVVWLKVHGVSLHIFEPGLLEQIGGLFGKVLHFSKFLEEEQDLSVIRLGVWVEEDEGVWVPDCLARSEAASSGEVSPLQSSPMVQVPAEQVGGNDEVREMDSRPVGEGSGFPFSKGDMGKG
ncbi:putative RNA recognition motif domain, nucleotide-binding alpha-beta plait domain superfamily [Helianthus annuus]|nr:putative RNA recognition motif domain, nucleotide-binding alpha-beta plait domain superfamily [Helianthus annuus]